MDCSCLSRTNIIITTMNFRWQKLTNQMPACCCITLLAGASALCLCFCWLEMKSIMLLLEEIKSRVIFLGGQSNLIPVPDDRSSFLWGATRGIGLEKCDHGGHKRHGQTVHVLKLLSRQFGEGMGEWMPACGNASKLLVGMQIRQRCSCLDVRNN